MRGLARYAALTTKIRAMQGRLLTVDDFKKLASAGSVYEALSFLCTHADYAPLFKDVDISTLHRGDIERILFANTLEEFKGLYKFSNGLPRRLLDIVALYNEIYFLKAIIRLILNNRRLNYSAGSLDGFFDKYTHLDIYKLTNSSNMTEVIENLRGTFYYNILSPVYQKENATIFDYEIVLDRYYFRLSWDFADKELTSFERDGYRMVLGTRIDLLNLQWIYRTKKYYHISPAQLYSFLIPIYYKLRPSDIKQMAQAATLEEYIDVFDTTFYGKILKKLFKIRPTLEEYYMAALNYTNTRVTREHPYSILSLSTYLYRKELEVEMVIEVIEAIRYGFSPDRIEKDILKFARSTL